MQPTNTRQHDSMTVALHVRTEHSTIASFVSGSSVAEDEDSVDVSIALLRNVSELLVCPDRPMPALKCASWVPVRNHLQHCVS
jgi:hypothetical protein